MITPTLEAQILLLDDRINILESNAAEYSPAKHAFEAVGDILALARDQVNAYKATVQLSDYCFDVCEALKATIQEERTEDLGEFAKTALEDVGRVIREIEGTLKTGTTAPHIKHDKRKIEGKKLEIQQILDALNTQSSSPDGNEDVDERALRSLSLDPPETASTSVSENAFGRLIRREFVSDELPSMIGDIFKSKDVDNTIRRLPKDDAQGFVDAVYQALDMPDLSLQMRVKCLRRLCRACSYHGILPGTLRIPTCYDRTAFPLYMGAYAGVWKGVHCGRDVAVKVLRTYSNNDLQKVHGKFCKRVLAWRTYQHPNVLPLIGVSLSETQFAMVSEWMVNGNLNEFVKANPDANRLELLKDVARGLIYIHHRGMIHGDLKGANILIDQTGHALLADFGLLTIVSDPATLLPASSRTLLGTLRWMSPELIAPGEFGLNTCRPTKSSDCYSLGMVIYETISGNPPFYDDLDPAVFLKVVKGERPHRGVGFTHSLWKMMEWCWMSQPSERPSIEDVLQRLEVCSNSPSPPSPGAGETEEMPAPPPPKCHHPKPSSTKLPLGPPKDPSPSTARNRRPANITAHSNPPSGIGSSTPSIIPPVNKSIPPLFLSEIDPSTFPPEFKKEGTDWLAVFNPRTDRVLDIDLVHTLDLDNCPPVSCLRLSADGEYLATGCGLTVNIYDTKTWKKTCVLAYETMDDEDVMGINCICFSPDGQLLATAARDNIIRIWSIADRQIRNRFLGHTGETLSSIVFSPDGRPIVSATGVGAVRIWDMSDGSSKTIAGTCSSLGSISPDARLVAAYDCNSVLCIWDTRTGELLERLWRSASSIFSVAFTPDGRGFVDGGSDKVVRYWDISRSADGPDGRPNSPSASNRGSLNHIEEVGRNGMCTMKLIGHRHIINSIAVSHDGQWVVSGSYDSQVRFLDARTGVVQLILRDRSVRANLIDLSPAGGILVTASGSSVRIWKYQSLPEPIKAATVLDLDRGDAAST